MSEEIIITGFDPAFEGTPNRWIHTNSGKQFSFNYTEQFADQICIEDIASHLSKICRYVGAVDEFYSVADHCCNLVDYLIDRGETNPYFLLGVLLHDSPEAYLSDIAAPAKYLPELKGYKRLEKRIFSVIANKFGCPNDKQFHTALDYYDKNIIRDEAEVLFEIKPAWALEYELLGAVIEVSPDHKAGRERYLDTYEDIMDRIKMYSSNEDDSAIDEFLL